jgi:hypothetical protein
MKNSITYFVVLLLLFTNCTTTEKDAVKIDQEAEKAKAIATVEGYFKSLPAFDYEAVKKYTTADYTVFENGKLYNNVEEFIEYLKTFEGTNLENSFKVKKTFMDKNSALVVLEFNAIVTPENEEKMEINGFENYYLVKKNDKWLIQFCHSTYFD